MGFPCISTQRYIRFGIWGTSSSQHRSSIVRKAGGKIGWDSSVFVTNPSYLQIVGRRPNIELSVHPNWNENPQRARKPNSALRLLARFPAQNDVDDSRLRRCLRNGCGGRQRFSQARRCSKFGFCLSALHKPFVNRLYSFCSSFSISRDTNYARRAWCNVIRAFVEKHKWFTAFSHRWRRHEHINALEAAYTLLGLQWAVFHPITGHCFCYYLTPGSSSER